MKKTQQYRTHLTVDGLDLPVQIVFERRRDTRFGITRRQASLRLPLGMPQPEAQRQLQDFQQWLSEKFVEKPQLRAAFAGKTYQTGDVLTVGTRRYILDVRTEERATHTAKLIGDTISIRLSGRASASNQEKSIRTLLSRVVAEDFHAEISRRIHDWNDRTFRRPIKAVFLKYNHSNWGSCSRDGNVNLSTRLLFAPPEVQDYVILHELAHLVELNHSDRFWALVAQHMPDYPVKEKWLKTYGSTCDF